MHKLTIHPINNGDCCAIDLQNGQKFLWDYADQREDYNLPEKLRADLKAANRDYYDVVAFTHMDKDHIQGFSDLFYLEHAQKYQDGDRIKIVDLWVPAAILLEKKVKDEYQILRAEARYRLKQKCGIRVFSNPDKLADWLRNDAKVDPTEVAHLITHAGEIVPGYSLEEQGAEIFVHSPFSASIQDNAINRNDAALAVQFTFNVSGRQTRVILGADLTHQVWTDIVKITKHFNNEIRLQSDVFRISHHCSYLSLSDVKGVTKTQPVEEVDWLFDQVNKSCILVSSSKPIPSDDTDAQPPHRQAAKYYKDVAKREGGEFVVTMEHPKKSNPKPLVIKINRFGAQIVKQSGSVASGIVGQAAPRAG